MHSKLKNIVKLIAEISLLILLFYLFLTKISFHDFYKLKDIFKWQFIPLLILINLLIPFFWSLAWYKILRAFYKVDVLEIFLAKIASQAISYVTPFVGIGGDVFVPSILANHERKAKTIIATIALERTIEVIAYGSLLSVASFVVLFSEIPLYIKIAMIAISLMLVIFLSLFLYMLILRKRIFSAILSWLYSTFHFKKFDEIKKKIMDFEEDLFFVLKKENKKVIIEAFIFKYIGLFFEVLKYVILFYALNHKKLVLFYACFALTSYIVVWILSFIPASLGGFEYTYITFFPEVGLSKTDALGFILIVRGLYTINVLIGLSYYFIKKSEMLKKELNKS
ncbi:MAG: lysylphosphatidylglycerol synthase transmembrane domain-containing protein [Candidatus Woesearchaeota archaeon]